MTDLARLQNTRTQLKYSPGPWRPATALVRLRRAAQISLPGDIREAARLKEGDYLEAEVTEAGVIQLRPVTIPVREIATMNLEWMFGISKFCQ